MINSIILAAVVLILIAAVKGSIRHMKGEGGCCGGGNGELPEREKKLEGAVVEKKILHIEGMTCAHCVNRVMAAVNNRRCFCQGKLKKKTGSGKLRPQGG